jgi:UPF0755 protein
MISKIIEFSQKKPLIFTFIILLVIFLIEFLILITPISSKAKFPVIIEVNKSDNLSDFTNKLYNKRVINSKFNFKLTAKILGLENKLKPGRYKITENHSYIGLVKYILRTSPEQPILFKIYQNSPLEKVINSLQINLGYDKNILKQYLYDPSYLRNYGFNAKNAEGYILPMKYEFYKSDDIEYVLNKMLYTTKVFFQDSLGISDPQKIHQILTLSSIVQGETNKIDEYPIIAGVYWNRIKKNMPLQACPTVQYALKRDRWDKITFKNLQINSPYNTYKHIGLPPGPIGSPSIQAIKATINPANHNYLFFVADGNGGHNFSESYNQHLNFKKNAK